MSPLSPSPAENTIGRIRPLNIMRDLPKVADLLELCFHKNMDSEGKSYVKQMRRASRDHLYLSWVSNSLPLKGYVWEDKKRIIGNISIIPFRKEKKNIALLANIAVHPDYRRKGIARRLTQLGIEDVQKRNVKGIWLQVDESNLGAISLYKDLGFEARALRTTWQANSNPPQKQKKTTIKVIPRQAKFWTKQIHWINQIYPKEIRWYRMPDWESFKPGLKYWLYKLFVEFDIQQKTVLKDGKLQAVLMWTRGTARRTPIWLATNPQTDSQSLTALLLHARLQLFSPNRTLTIDYPANQFEDAFTEADFIPHRTLLWMKKESQ